MSPQAVKDGAKLYWPLMIWARGLQAEISKAFGRVLQRRRKAKGLPQEALAEKADIHPTHVGLIERCERNPSLDVANSLAKAFGVSLSEMISEAERLQKSE
jgi:transcriptional regulator with XRE-family HTH domain